MFAVLAALSFGASGSLVKPLLESGWSPTAAALTRTLTGGLLLLPFALIAMRGRWAAVRRARWHILLMGVVGVAALQLAFFAAIRTLPVSTAILIEFLAPIILVGVAWARTRRVPRAAVLVGSGLAVVGLVLVIGPGALIAVDPVGVLFAIGAAVACAAYFVLAAKPADDLPPVALATFGLLVGGAVLAIVGATGVLPLTATFGELPFLSRSAPWWLPVALVAVIGTALAYALGTIAASALGSRLASFVALLEVVCASIFAWILLGEALSALQLLGGALILGGIAAVRSDRGDRTPVVEPVPTPVATQSRRR
jgi:drug/metabolite transporter (DMT)-like permease